MTKHATSRAIMSGLLLNNTILGVPMMDAAGLQARIDNLEAKRVELHTASEAILDALGDSEDLSDDQTETINKNTTEIEKLDRQITALQALLPKGAGRKSAAEPKNENGGRDPRRVTTLQVRDTGKHNFMSFGEQLVAARLHAQGKHEAESVKKLTNAVTTYGNEGSGADGGFLVAPDFARQIWQKVEAEENLMNRCAQLTPTGNAMQIPKDETTPWGTAGIRTYWDGEAAAATASKAQFELSTLRLYKLTSLVPASEELLEDSFGYESFVMAKVPGIIAATINDKIVDGTGVGMPLGILNAAGVVSVAKETSQPADTVWFSNINKMWSRMYAPWRRNSVWLINQDIEPSLHGMAFQATGASSMLPGTSAVPAYLPMNGLSGSPYATLMGRPVIPVQACKTVGDVGDIILVDLNQYWILRKASGLKVDTSIHFYFDQAVTAFRFIFRMNGQPAWSAVITPQNGSNTLSWAVTLAAR